MIGARDWNEVVAPRVHRDYAAPPPMPVLVRVAMVSTWGTEDVSEAAVARVFAGACRHLGIAGGWRVCADHVHGLIDYLVADVREFHPEDFAIEVVGIERRVEVLRDNDRADVIRYYARNSGTIARIVPKHAHERKA